MRTLRYGDSGSLVSLLQEGLRRAGYDPGGVDGDFGRSTRWALEHFQRSAGLLSDGIAGEQTYRALDSFLLGYARHTLRRGDTLWSVAARYGSSLLALETANPGLNPFNLQPGERLTVPYGYNVVPENVPVSSTLLDYCVRGLSARYPFLVSSRAGESVLGSPLWTLRWGGGQRRVFYSAAYHGNEWITALLLLRYVETLCAALSAGETVAGVPAEELWERSELTLLPLVNPDGADLVTGALDAEQRRGAEAIAASWPSIPYPSGWKANIRGTDPNLQFPALWDRAREIKFAQGYTRPAPRDYVGAAPLCAPESRAVYELTLSLSPERVLAYHTQGEVIYWRFQDLQPPGSQELTALFAALSGYAPEDVPLNSSFAGFKDWFILHYDRPGFTIEAGTGENPLPLSQLPEMFRRNLGLLTAAAESSL